MAIQFLLEKLKGRDDLEELSLDWRLILKWNLKVCLIQLSLHRSQLRAVGNMVLDFRVAWKRGNFLTNRASTAFPRGVSVYEVVFSTCVPIFFVCVCMYYVCIYVLCIMCYVCMFVCM